MLRKFPRPVKRVVIKVGSSVIATYQMKPRAARLRSLVAQMAEMRKQGLEVILVSSGAIVLGMGELNQTRRPSDLAAMQAMAAIGQTVLMRRYVEFFKTNAITCAQVLLTWEDFDNRQRFNNARNAFRAMMARKVIPIVNENDTIATDEIKFGDNDKLSALVASLVQADLLVILSDVEGFYDMKAGRKKVFQEIKEITREIEGMAQGTAKKHMARGGMSAKLEAVKIATHSKIPCVIANGQTKDVLRRIIQGERIGTLFFEKEEKVIARKHWISFGSKPKGVLVIDDGAKAALLKGGKSLLLPGIVAWEGHFRRNDVVIVQDTRHREIARGITRYSVSDLHKLDNRKGKQEAIHCDNLVLCER